jgi:hypothetical protein
MRGSALLVTDDNNPRRGRCVAKLIQFFGIPSHNLAAAEFVFANAAGSSTSEKPRVLCSAEAFLRIIEAWEQKPDYKGWWTKYVHSAFIYSGNDQDSLQRLARILTRDDQAVLHEIDTDAGDFAVSDELSEFCGVMAGVRVAASKANSNGNLVLSTTKGDAINIISLGHGATFLKVEYKGVALFLSTSKDIIDIDAELASRNFDVRNHFLSAVPIVLYIKWAFAETCWKAPEANACLVIDDPLLKPSYGCVNFDELLALMEHHDFSTNIAFIPWNWRRSNSKVARLFKQKPERYSLSIHGSDHVAAEFGSSDRQRVRSKARQAVDRMSGHETRTGIHYDRIMVFPQGVFSQVAMDVLKRSNFTAAVNTEVMSVDLHPQAIRISDVWDVAVMRYSDFPIFTRRYPSQGIENFAFDILLGKPCIVVIHHDFCRDRYKHLLDFVNRLNSLRCPLSWCSLGEVVRRSCRQRELSSGLVEVEMYGAELRVENRSTQSKRFLIRRCECEPSAIREIRSGSGPIAWNSVNGQVNFEIELNPGEHRMIGIRFHSLDGNGRSEETLSYRTKTMLRRYLCEVRDNYITPTRSRLAGSLGHVKPLKR